MAISVPSTQTISDNLIAAIEASIGKSIPLLPKSFTRVLAKATAGVFILTYKYGAWSLLQQFAAHASFRPTVVNGITLTPLIEWGRLVGVGDPVISPNAEHTVSFDVLDTDSSTWPAGSQLVHPSSGVIYITLSDVVLDATPKTVDVLAASDPDGNGGGGTQGNRNVGDALKWANPIPQLSTLGATVTATVVQAADAETEDNYRARVVQRFGARPQGGAYSDYRIWGEEVAGIIRIYPYTADLPGEVDVYAEATVASSGSADGIPTDAQLLAVAQSIEQNLEGLAERRQTNAMVNTFKIARVTFDVTVTGLVADDVAAAEATIEAAVDELLRSREPFIVGLSLLPRTDRITSASVAGTANEAADTEGGTITSLELSFNGGPVTAYTLADGEKAKLGTITFV